MKRHKLENVAGLSDNKFCFNFIRKRAVFSNSWRGGPGGSNQQKNRTYVGASVAQALIFLRCNFCFAGVSSICVARHSWLFLLLLILLFFLLSLLGILNSLCCGCQSWCILLGSLWLLSSLLRLIFLRCNFCFAGVSSICVV